MWNETTAAKKMKSSIKDSSSKFDEIQSKVSCGFGYI